MGIWSHYPDTEQTYAVDYGNDAGDEVLCSRPGVIFDMRDTIEDNVSDEGWNYVEILHFQIYAQGSDKGVPGITLPPVGVAEFRTQFWDYEFLNPDGTYGKWYRVPVPRSFEDGTLIPSGTLFPPYWEKVTDSTGDHWDLTLGHLPILHPSACILPAGHAPINGFSGFDQGTQFEFLLEGHDRCIEGKTFPAGKTFDDGVTPIPAGAVFMPDVGETPSLSEPWFPPGTQFTPLKPPIDWYPPFASYEDPAIVDPPPLDRDRAWRPFTSTFMSYGHGINSFMQVVSNPTPGGNHPDDKPYVDIYPSRNKNEVRGMYVPQGRLIMYSGDTGISAYNHLHSHVITGTRSTWTIPFVYRDAIHSAKDHGVWKSGLSDGILRACTFYTGTQTRIAP